MEKDDTYNGCEVKWLDRFLIERKFCLSATHEKDFLYGNS
jgi:hypothetical protein